MLIKLVFIGGIILALCSPVLAYVITADNLVCEGDCTLTSVIVSPDGTNNVLVEVYNGQSASGIKILTFNVLGTIIDPRGVIGNTVVKWRGDAGLYIDLTIDGGGTASVSYTLL